jgi:SHS2 domain-containing protein
MNKKSTGFREIAHTADWELEVWAPDYFTLLEQSSIGMYKLMGVCLDKNITNQHSIKIPWSDQENTLVTFLSELVYICESEGLAFYKFEFSVSNNNLIIDLQGSPILSMEKEIKAVTYHNLKIETSLDELNVHIVFDV